MDFDHRDLYRLPWNAEDNVFGWIAPGRRPIDRIAADLGALARVRRFDGLVLAGAGHPRLDDVVRLVASHGYKPVLETGGLSLDEPQLRSLRQAGLAGITFHVDSLQRRAGWRDATEPDLNELRLRFAELAARVGGLHCVLKARVSPATLPELPGLVQWAQDHIELVHGMIFAGAPSCVEMVGQIQQRFPEFMPAAYLAGTERPESIKWLLALRVGTSEQICGYAGPKAMELLQGLHHALFGRYFARTRPSLLAAGRAGMLAAALVDRGARAAFVSWLRAAAGDPLRLLEPQHFQTLVFVQPAEAPIDGRWNMCDGCPEMAAHEGELIWSCRLPKSEERLAP